MPAPLLIQEVMKPVIGSRSSSVVLTDKRGNFVAFLEVDDRLARRIQQLLDEAGEPKARKKD